MAAICHQHGTGGQSEYTCLVCLLALLQVELTSPWQVSDAHKIAVGSLLHEYRAVFEAEGLLEGTSMHAEDLRVGGWMLHPVLAMPSVHACPASCMHIIMLALLSLSPGGPLQMQDCISPAVYGWLSMCSL